MSMEEEEGSRKIKSVEELYPCPKEYSCLKREITDEDQVWLYGKLKKYGNFTGTLWLLYP